MKRKPRPFAHPLAHSENICYNRYYRIERAGLYVWIVQPIDGVGLCLENRWLQKGVWVRPLHYPPNIRVTEYANR